MTVPSFIKAFIFSFVHLNAPTPDTFRNEKVNGKLYMPKGVEQRNAGLTWLRTHNVYDGVVYFMDDDNTYHPRVSHWNTPSPVLKLRIITLDEYLLIGK